jgi:predicted RNA polymerase sigma factor
MPEEVLPPPQLLSKSEMVGLLVQLHLLEARVEASRLSPDSARALFQQQKSEILRKNNVSEKDSVLQRSYRFYAVNRKDMDEIYKVVIDSLERRTTKLNASTQPVPPRP